MGIFGPFVYKSKKNGQKFWLHMKVKGNAKIYYFSKDPTGALFDLPRGYEVVENPKTGMPFLRKKTSFGFFSLFKPKKEEKAEAEEISK
ncbi:MAG: hypothetical protein QW451_01170 [Candidatus Aenigmatarchaeota archaeon]